MPSRPLLILSLLAGLLAAPATAGAACRLENSQVRVKTREARVLVRRELDGGFPGTRYYACLKRGRPRELGFAADEPGLGLDEIEPVRLAGRYVAFGSAETTGQDISGRVTVLDLRRGRRVLDVEAGRPGEDLTRTAGVSDLALLRDGTVAWIAGVADPAATYQVHLVAGGLRRLVAASPDVDPKSLRLTARAVAWTEGTRKVSPLA